MVEDVGSAGGVDRHRVFRRQVLVERLLVERAGLAVDADEEGLVAERLDVLDEVLRHEPRHLVHALVGLEEGAQVDRAVQDRVEVGDRSEEHTSELQSLMRISYAVVCLKKKKS